MPRIADVQTVINGSKGFVFWSVIIEEQIITDQNLAL
jgi:hypothetical protein